MKQKHLYFVFLFLLFTIPFSADTEEEVLYWMKIRAENKFERTQVVNAGISIDRTIEEFVYATGTIDDVNTMKKMGKLELGFPITHAMDFPDEDSNYHNYQELTDQLKKLVGEHKEISRLISIGKSIEGRDIWAVQISGNLKQAEQLPAITLMGGHHAREHLSVELPLNYIEYFLTQYSLDAKIKTLVDGRMIHIIPAVNPDGLEFDVATGKYKLWRKNRKINSNGTVGVDLNRNYGYKWGTGGSSSSGSSDVYMGSEPFSEPETKAIKQYIESNQNISILLSFHTFSELILYPWGHKYSGIENARDKQVHEVMANKMAEWNAYQPMQSSDLYIASGDTTDWSYGEHKIISFTFELDPASDWGASAGFYPEDEIIPVVTQKNLNPILYLIGYADNPYRVLD